MARGSVRFLITAKSCTANFQFMPTKDKPALTEIQKLKVKEIVSKNALRSGTLAKAAILVYEELQIEISVSQLSRYLKQCEQEWQKNVQKDIGVIKAKEVAALEALSSDVYEQWERSKLNAETLTTEIVGVGEKEIEGLSQLKEDLKDVDFDKFADDPRDPGPDLEQDAKEELRDKEKKIEVKTKETKKSAGQYGDPQLASTIIKISERKAKLLGLDAPSRIQADISNKDPKEMTNDELIAERKRLQQSP